MAVSANKTLDIKTLLGSGERLLATEIALKYQEWDMLRNKWLGDRLEVRNYVFATSTKTTSNSTLPWKNSTTIPKLCQIRDNLHANYIAALFPNNDWLDWEANNKDAAAMKKARAIKGYMHNKVKASGFKQTVELLLLDWIDTGICEATVEYVDESRIHPVTEELIPGYVGPKLVRVPASDLVFNPTAVDFEHTPKIIRTLKSFGELQKDIKNNVYDTEAKKAFEEAKRIRSEAKNRTITDTHKNTAYVVDGFGSYHQYLNSGTVEILTFYGDIYDSETETFLENQIISVLDRAFVLSSRPNPSWLGRDGFRLHGWRKRPGNLYAMGPLDNLVGMQYRIDHLENLKADAFDMIAFPMMAIRGNPEYFTYAPGEKIFLGDDGSVEFLHPDVTALNADMQIRLLEDKMEEMAGAPKQAMGIRTPGEKTAFEVQVLENAASRIFLNKILAFEEEFLNPLLNDMLEVGRRNMASAEIVKTLSSDIDSEVFLTITKDDLYASGKIAPVGASHFAKRANYLQNLVQLMNTLGRDPGVRVHLSGKALAKAAEDILDLDRFDIFTENAQVMENLETQKLMQVAEEELAVHGQTEGMPPALGVVA